PRAAGIAQGAGWPDPPASCEARIRQRPGPRPQSWDLCVPGHVVGAAEAGRLPRGSRSPGRLAELCLLYRNGAPGAGHEGWIRFGQPGLPTRPPLEAEHFIEPKPGMLVLFPSYMWHGTVPFGGDKRRLTFAFDLLPGPAPLAGEA